MVVYLSTQARSEPLCNYKIQTPFSDVHTNCTPSSWQFNLESTNCQWHYVLQCVCTDADDSPSVNSDRKLITWPVLHTADSFRSVNAVAVWGPLRLKQSSMHKTQNPPKKIWSFQVLQNILSPSAQYHELHGILATPFLFHQPFKWSRKLGLWTPCWQYDASQVSAKDGSFFLA